MRRTASFIAALAVTAMLVLAATASAARFRVEPAGNFNGTTTFLYLAGFGGTISCSATMSGAFNSSLTKEAGSSVGTITGFTINTCRPGNYVITSLNSSSNVAYTSFSGTLPDIISLNARIVDVQVLFRFNLWPTFDCLFQGNLNLRLEIVSGVASSAVVEGTLSRHEAALNSVLFCEGEIEPAFVAGTFALSPRMRVTLI